MAFNAQHSDFISLLRQTVGAAIAVKEDKVGVLVRFFALCEEYFSQGLNPAYGDKGAGRDPITDDDFKGQEHLTADKVLKGALVGMALKPLLAATTVDEYDRAAAGMRALVELHFGRGGGPIVSILNDLK